MTLEISPEKMAIYKRTARERHARDKREMLARREKAWTIARQAAQLLKERFGATRVMVFGSLAHGAWFHARSDIDLAAEGIAPADYFTAGAALDQMRSGFELDLIRCESAPPRLLSSIEQGVKL